MPGLRYTSLPSICREENHSATFVLALYGIRFIGTLSYLFFCFILNFICFGIFFKGTRYNRAPVLGIRKRNIYELRFLLVRASLVRNDNKYSISDVWAFKSRGGTLSHLCLCLIPDSSRERDTIAHQCCRG